MPRRYLDAVVRVLDVHRKELVHERELLDKLVQGIHLERFLVQQRVQVSTGVDAPELAKQRPTARSSVDSHRCA